MAGMIRVLPVVVLFAAALLSCSADMKIDRYEFGCTSDQDCGPGYKCDAVRGCVKVSQATDAGTRDAGERDAGQDVGDAGEDGDAADIGDGGGGEDAGMDAGDIGVVEYVSRTGSLYEFSAGVCEDGRYILRSVTGFNAAQAMENDYFVLQRSVLFLR